jgi:hypothetical protein
MFLSEKKIISKVGVGVNSHCDFSGATSGLEKSRAH